MHQLRLGVLAALLSATVLSTGLIGPAGAQTLRIGLNEDADVLDPHQARTYVGRIVFTALCDKLIDYDEKLDYIPQLATSWQWAEDAKSITFKLRPGVRFHDGEPFDAAAVKFNIDRAKSLPESRRKSEIAEIAGAEVIDPSTVKLTLTAPFAPLLAQLADRAGMMVSPKAAKEMTAAQFGLKPVCAGPFKFAERVAQDRIVLDRFADYWNKDQIHFDRVVYQPITNTTVRLANLQAGSLELIERMSPNDLPAAKRDRRLKVAEAIGIGYQGLTFNIANGDKVNTPIGRDPRIRQAIELSIDRAAINDVVFAGAHSVGNQPVPPNHPSYAKAFPVPRRDVAKAKALLAAAGQPSLAIDLLVSNTSDAQAVGQVVQSMLKETGIDAKITVIEFATALNMQTKGDFSVFLIGWSGRVDADGNVHIFTHSTGALNEGKYVNAAVDKALDDARTVIDQATRSKHYAVAFEQMLKDLPRIYLYHENRHFAMSSRLQGFVPNPDGLIRLTGVRLQ